MVDYLSVSISILVITGLFMYHCLPECMPECIPKNIILSEDIIQHHILSFLPPKNRLYINKATNKNATIALKRDFVRAYYPHVILKALGGIDRCVNNYRFIKSLPQMVGGTDYIDGVRIVDLPDTDSNVYLGIDNFRRPFAILRYWVGPTDEYDTDGDYETEPYKPLVAPKQVVVSMFQRYTSSSPYLHAVLSANYMTTWCLGTCYSSRYMPGDNCVSEETLEKIGKLLNGQRIILKGWRCQCMVLGITKELVSL